jgi:hypothetical protein
VTTWSRRVSPGQWASVVLLTALATAPAAALALLATADSAFVGGGGHVEPDPTRYLVCALVAAAWDLGACVLVLRRAGWRFPLARGIAAAGATPLLCVAASNAVSGNLTPAVVVLAVPEVVFAALTVRRWLDLAVRTLVGVPMVVVGLVAAYAVFLVALVAAPSGISDETGNVLLVVVLVLAVGVGHAVVFVSSGLAGWLAYR